MFGLFDSKAEAEIKNDITNGYVNEFLLHGVSSVADSRKLAASSGKLEEWEHYHILEQFMVIDSAMASTVAALGKAGEYSLIPVIVKNFAEQKKELIEKLNAQPAAASNESIKLQKP